MNYGVTMFPTDSSISPVDLAVAAEQRGFDSIWFPEHSHIPASRRTPFPGGGELPKMYYDVMEPFVALAAAASVTKTIKLATGICLVIQRDPIQTAASVATLDRVSNGRVLFGIGAGWNEEEMENHGTDPTTRMTLMRERVEAMKAIWTQSKAEYHGKFVDFDPIMAWPKPVQQPHPPVHVGGGWPHAAKRAIRYGDGWSPIHGFGDLASKLPEFRKLAEEAGRDPASLPVSIFGIGPSEQDAAAYRDAGAERLVFALPSAESDKVLPLLDRYRALIDTLG
jgi:probable F420-dependent oxidoreductase